MEDTDAYIEEITHVKTTNPKISSRNVNSDHHD